MDELWQQQIRERAFLIWQREGSSAGSPDQFNLMAEQELLAEGQTPFSNPLDEQPDRTREEAQIDDAIDDSFRPAIHRPGPARRGPAHPKAPNRPNHPSQAFFTRTVPG